ncbi:hypothetical protein [Sulfobacillus thermosulfidooxidans]|uniref:hypothetical protein n=1 Tax=Sulfobacillus thermosulfidooxidans TaxID=28034 RepID=UPI000AAFB519|nr:hypothetical protein [Sulfobacillus thermosulfidooxidans]
MSITVSPSVIEAEHYHHHTAILGDMMHDLEYTPREKTVPSHDPIPFLMFMF